MKKIHLKTTERTTFLSRRELKEIKGGSSIITCVCYLYNFNMDYIDSVETSGTDSGLLSEQTCVSICRSACSGEYYCVHYEMKYNFEDDIIV